MKDHLLQKSKCWISRPMIALYAGDAGDGDWEQDLGETLIAS